MDKGIAKKNVLFIGCGFMQYDPMICVELKKKCSVTYVNESYYRHKFPYITSFVRNRLKCKHLVERIEGKYISDIINNSKEIDVVFLIYGPESSLSSEHLSNLKKLYPSADYVLYLWDDWNRIDKKEMLLEHFSTIYSFDTEDCRQYGFRHRPLFYSTVPDLSGNERTIDVSHIGTAHSNRLESLLRMKELCLANNLRYYFRLVIGPRPYFVWKYILKNKYSNYMDIVAPKVLSYRDYLNVLDKSKAVVDFPHPTQCGLTSRTIEALSRGVKVITSNKYIRDHRDIPESMYLVMDESFSAKAMTDFISNHEIRPLPQRYALSAFLAEMLKI